MRTMLIGLVAAIALACFAIDETPPTAAAASPVAWEPLGGRLAGAPAVASWAPGRLDVFAPGGDGQLWHRWFDGGWSAWEPLGGLLVGAPAVASWGPGRLDVFVTGVDGQLWHRAFDGGWWAWEPLGGLLGSSPAVASWAPGRLDVFAAGADGQLWHRAFEGGWFGWGPLGGRLAGAPAVASWAPGRLDVFITGVDGQLWHRPFDGGWWPWGPLGGRLSSGPAVASWAAGRLDVFARGGDGQLWHRWFEGGWSGWEPIGGALVGAPAVASWAPGRLDVFVDGLDAQLWHTWYDGGWPAATLRAVVINGQGSGHGRGLSAWGTFGWAVNYGWTWQQILDHYYGNTTWGAVGNIPMRIRLMALDGRPESGVISTSGAAMWGGVGYVSLLASETAQGVFDIYASSTRRLCPGTFDETWTLIQQGVPGPILFTTPYDETTAAPGDVLGLCQPDGSIVHYRGSIQVLSDATGVNRTVNETYLQNYLRGVMPREVPATWGNAGGGAGMNALWAFSVAARSFGVSQNRYAYAKTCDTTACQVYGGTAHRRPGPNDAVTVREHPLTDRAVADTGGTVRVWPDGRIVSTEYSASHGPRNAGGQFPAVDDPADNVPQNPNHRWSRTLDANAIGARYGIGQLTAAWTERDPSTIYDGVWGNRVRLQGTAGAVTVAAWDFRNTWGFPSPGFVISGTS